MHRELPYCVHIIGEYAPSLTGLEAFTEKWFFREIFWKSNFARHAHTAYLMGDRHPKQNQKDYSFTEAYVKDSVHKQDIVVLLNPLCDMSSYTARRHYVDLVLKVRGKIGGARMVLAFQSREVKARLALPYQDDMWAIDSYAQRKSYVDGFEEFHFLDPVQEESVGIVASILEGKDKNTLKK